MKISHHPPKNKTPHSGHMCISLKLTKCFWTRHPFTKLHFSASFPFFPPIHADNPSRRHGTTGRLTQRVGEDREQAAEAGQARTRQATWEMKIMPQHKWSGQQIQKQSESPRQSVPPSFSSIPQDRSLCKPNRERTPRKSKQLLVAAVSRYSTQAVSIWF